MATYMLWARDFKYLGRWLKQSLHCYKPDFFSQFFKEAAAALFKVGSWCHPPRWYRNRCLNKNNLHDYFCWLKAKVMEIYALCLAVVAARGAVRPSMLHWFGSHFHPPLLWAAVGCVPQEPGVQKIYISLKLSQNFQLGPFLSQVFYLGVVLKIFIIMLAVHYFPFINHIWMLYMCKDTYS